MIKRIVQLMCLTCSMYGLTSALRADAYCDGYMAGCDAGLDAGFSHELVDRLGEVVHLAVPLGGQGELLLKNHDRVLVPAMRKSKPAVATGATVAVDSNPALPEMEMES